MKKVSLLMTLFLFSIQNILCQPGFNLVKDLSLPTNHFRDMLVDNDTIIGYGLAYNDTMNWQQGLLLAKFDSSGNFITSNLILDSLGDFLGIDKSWGKIIKTSDGGYAMTAAPLIRNSAVLIKVNHSFETEFIKEFEDTVNLSNYNYRLIEIQDGYLLYGSIQRPNYLDDAFIRRVDKQGNTIWFNYYGNYNVSDNILDIKKVNDSTFVAGSVDGISPDIFGGSRTTLRYIDWHGNVLETWQSETDPEIGYIRKVMVKEDGDIITYGLSLVDIIFDTKIVQPTIAGFSPDFQLQWVKHYGEIKSLSAEITFRDIEPTLDGNFIAAGESGIYETGEPTLPSGWLMKFSPEGDSLWSRYDLSPFAPHYSNDHFFGGVGVLSSGNIVAGGSASEGNKKYIWLVKVTPDGCLDTLFCQPTISFESVVEENTSTKIYPNPATNFLFISSNLPGNQPLQFTLFDATGRIILNQPIQGSTSETRLDLSDFSPGMYFYKIEREGKPVKSGKLVVARNE